MKAGNYGNLLVQIEQPRGEYAVTIAFLRLITTLVKVAFTFFFFYQRCVVAAELDNYIFLTINTVSCHYKGHNVYFYHILLTFQLYHSFIRTVKYKISELLCSTAKIDLNYRDYVIFLEFI